VLEMALISREKPERRSNGPVGRRFFQSLTIFHDDVASGTGCAREAGRKAP
jgi:hypothetical protein